MQSSQTRSTLARLLSVLASAELKVEAARQELASSPNFEPSTAFKRLDNPRIGSITLSSLSSYLSDSGISASSREVQQLFNVLDQDQDLRVSYTEFQEAILPRRDAALKRRALSRDPYFLASGDLLPRDAENGLAQVIEEELRALRSVQVLREDLADSLNFSPSALFNYLDDNGQGFLDYESVERFQKENGFRLTEREIEAIFLRLDLDKDGKISYSEFAAGIRPVTPSAASYSPRRSSPIRASSPRRLSPSRAAALERSVERERMAESLRRSPPRRNSPRRIPGDLPSRVDREYEDYLAKSYERSEILRRSSPSRVERNLVESTVRLSETVRTSPLRSTIRERSRSPRRSPRRSASPLRPSDELELVRSLKQMIDNERDVEREKTDLALRGDFNLLDAFRIFDLSERTAVSQRQFEAGLNRLGVYASPDDIYLFFHRFNLDQTGQLRYADFCDAVLPRAPEYARMMESRKAGAFADFNENEVASEILRKRTISRPFFTINDAFQALDREDKGYITADEFQLLLEDYGIFTTRRDVARLMDKYDKRQVGRVSYRDFLDETVPKSPRKY